MMKKDEKILEMFSSERKKAESLAKDEASPLFQLLGENEMEKYRGLIEYDKGKQVGVKREGSDEDLLFYTYNDSNLEVLFNAYNADPDLETGDEDRKFYSLLNKLFCKPKVVQVCELLSDQIFTEGKFAIDIMTQLKQTMVKKMKESPFEENQKEKELSDMVQYSGWAKDELAVLSRRFAMTMNKQAQKIGDKCKEASQIQERTDAVITHSKEMADFLGRTAENKMIWERKKSEYVQESLSTEAKKLDTEFDLIFTQNLTKEKNLRVKRYKTEAQLITILKKYDIDIKERDKAYKELLTLFNEEQKQLTEIKDQFETQAIDYHALMDEKEEYERTIWEEKLYEIQTRMAARRIQKYYRDYVALCQAAGFVRFKKRGKGKKKKAAA